MPSLLSLSPISAFGLPSEAEVLVRYAFVVVALTKSARPLPCARGEYSSVSVANRGFAVLISRAAATRLCSAPESSG